MKDQLRSMAAALYKHLLFEHWSGTALVGPDPGIRLNARVGRFIKSYLHLGWADQLTYMQAQAYWIFGNWMLAETEGGSYIDVALQSSDFVVNAQRSDGAWDYPNPEWRGRVATVEGCFAALALLESHRHHPSTAYVDAALKWNAYVEDQIGYRVRGGVNYFAHGSIAGGGGVPNNTTLVLWLSARLAQVTGDESCLRRAPDLVNWLGAVQEDTGELPYKIDPDGTVHRHFLCYNYNAFEFMDLANYLEITGDSSVEPILARLSDYLVAGLTDEGHCRYECERDAPVVLYYSTALARALTRATSMGLGEYRAEAERLYRWAAANQRKDGSFAFYSIRNYGFLADRRSYPRYLSMILFHILEEVRAP